MNTKRWRPTALLLLAACATLAYYAWANDCEYRGGVLVYASCLKRDALLP